MAVHITLYVVSEDYTTQRDTEVLLPTEGMRAAGQTEMTGVYYTSKILIAMSH